MKTCSITILSLLLCGSLSAYAQTRIGYTNGTFDRKDGIRLNDSENQQAAIKISAAKLSTLKGKKIVSIRSVFGSRNLEEVKFFITDKLGGTPLYEQEITGYSTSWEDFELDTPFEITGDKDLYFGFNINCSESYRPLGFDRSYGEPGTTFGLDRNGKWTDLYGLRLGCLNLQLELDDTPQFTDASIRTFDASGFYQTDNAYTFKAQLFNFGSETITDFDVKCKLDDNKTQTVKITGVEIKNGETYDFDLPQLTAEQYGRKNVELEISGLSGKTDTDGSDNTRSCSVYFYPSDMERSYLVENFTSQSCTNCPSGHTVMEAALKERPEKTVEIAHHAGYAADIFTMSESAEYTWFYNNPSTYAPAIMINRAANVNVNPEAPVVNISAAYINALIDNISKEQPYVGLKFDTDYDTATRTLTGTLKIKTFVKPDGNGTRLTLCLMQDSIEASQIGGGSNYMHRHVFRGTLNGAWGEPVDLEEDGEIVKEISYNLPEAIMSTYSGDEETLVETDPEKMYLIAIISNFNENDATDCMVYNSAATKFTGSGSTSIKDIQAEGIDVRMSISGNSVKVTGSFDDMYIYDASGKYVRHCANSGDTFTMTNGIYITRAIKDGQVKTGKMVIGR